MDFFNGRGDVTWHISGTCLLYTSEYAIKGGLAGSYAYRTEKDRTNYIKEVYEMIVTRDLVQKYTLPGTLVLQRLSEFLMDNISRCV